MPHKRLRHAIVPACVLSLATALVAATSNSANPSASRPAPPPPAGRFIPLETGTLFIPESFRPADREIDLLVHFHGDPATVGRNVEAARLNAAVLIINYPGLSAAYSTPMKQNPDLFAQALAAALSRLERENIVPPGAAWRKVCVSSFSAGYGAVRELLQQERYFDRIDGLCMLDSIYAGYVEDADAQPPSSSQNATPQKDAPATAPARVRRVNPAHMQEFRRFARAAAEGRKTFILTHTYLVPGSYASTIETADDLLTHIGADRKSSDEPIADSPVHVIFRAAKGQFKLWGCAGEDGEAHMQHLRHMRIWLVELPLQRR